MIKSKRYTYKVSAEEAGKLRLSEYVKGLFPYLETGSAVKKAIKKNQIKINDKIGNSGDWVFAGCEIEFEWYYEIFETEAVDLKIYYEDEYFMIVRKPPGLPSSGNSRSLQQQLQGIAIEDSEDSLPFPYLVHRLDKATEGLIIAAKKMTTRRLLAKMLEDYSIIKQYVLIVEGILTKPPQWLTHDLDDKVAKTEILRSTVLDTKDPTTKIYAQIHTGRMHQIRRHLRDIGYPIVGDQLYNNEGLTFGTGLLLCAYSLEFLHPITKKVIKMEYPIPKKIDKYQRLK